MPHASKTAGHSEYSTPNAENRYQVHRADLPVHCPMPAMSLWNSHPRVYIPLAESGEAKCPYCGAVYQLVD